MSDLSLVTDHFPRVHMSEMREDNPIRSLNLPPKMPETAWVKTPRSRAQLNSDGFVVKVDYEL